MITTNAIITLPSKINIEINRRNLIKFESKTRSRSEISQPVFGIISNSGTVEFKDDAHRMIEQYNDGGLLVDGCEFTAFIVNTLNKKKEQIASLITSNWKYATEGKTVSVSIQDDLQEWQDISIENLSYNPKNRYEVIKDGSMKYLYQWLFERTPSKYNMLNYDSLDSKTRDILDNTKMLYPILSSKNLWAAWTQLCEVCMLSIYKNPLGKTVCKYTIW